MRTHLALAASLAVLLPGCDSSSPIACHPVRGVVVRDGKPVVEAMVVLHPVVETAELKQKPMGFTDDAGQFAVTTFVRGDGAPVGEYRVTVVQRAPKLVGEELVREGPNMLPRRLSDPHASGITLTVVEGENEMPRIDVPKR